MQRSTESTLSAYRITLHNSTTFVSRHSIQVAVDSNEVACRVPRGLCVHAGQLDQVVTIPNSLTRTGWLMFWKSNVYLSFIEWTLNVMDFFSKTTHDNETVARRRAEITFLNAFNFALEECRDSGRDMQ